MWLSRLNQMSVGPLWVLRNQAGAQPSAPSSMMAILAEPLTDPAQQTLLQNCLRAAGWNDIAVIALHSNCSTTSEAALQTLQTQVTESNPRTLIVFGATAAHKINPEFKRGQIYRYQQARLVVTYHPHEMMANPALKAQVWADLCMAAYAS